MFYKIYKGLVGISLPPEISRNTRASRSPNCAPFHQLATLNDTYKYSFYPRAIRTWNSVPLSLIPDSLDEFKAILASRILYCIVFYYTIQYYIVLYYILFMFILLDFIACSYIYLYISNS